VDKNKKKSVYIKWVVVNSIWFIVGDISQCPVVEKIWWTLVDIIKWKVVDIVQLIEVNSKNGHNLVTTSGQ
jgi:hypothetical protein